MSMPPSGAEAGTADAIRRLAAATERQAEALEAIRDQLGYLGGIANLIEQLDATVNNRLIDLA